MKPYSNDLRERIIAAHDRGEGSIRELASLYDVSPNSVQNWLNLRRSTGEIAPRPHGGGVPPRVSDEDLDAVAALVAAQPDATTAELAARFRRERGVAVSRPTMGRALARAGLTRKTKRPPRDGA